MIRGTLVKNKTIGILGGMGAAASVRLYSEIVKISQAKYGARRDDEFPPMLIYNLPLAGLDASGISSVRAEAVRAQLVSGVKKLEQGGADFVVIPCNTAHYFYDAIQDALDIPVLSLIEATADVVERERCERVSVLCSQSTSRWGLYKKVLHRRGVETIAVSEQQQRTVTRVIARVVGGTQDAGDTRALQDVIQDLAGRGAQGVVLGCTELPLAIRQSQAPVKIFDTIRILAESAIANSLATSAVPSPQLVSFAGSPLR